MKAQRYLRYLPDFVAEYAEFQKLGEIEGEILEEEAKAKQEMEQDQWILTATRKGLLCQGGHKKYYSEHVIRY